MEKKLRVVFFTEIKNFTSPSLVHFERELLHELKKCDLEIEEYSHYQTNKFKDNEWISLLISVPHRYLIYPWKARKDFSLDAIHHISNNAYVTLLNFVPKKYKTIVQCHDLVAWIPLKDMPYQLDRGGVLRHLFVKIFKGWAIKKADYLISDSHHTKKDLVKYFNIPEEKIIVIYLGVNHEIFHPRPLLSARKKLELSINKKIILDVANKEPRKNIELLIESFFLLLKKLDELKLIHIGLLSKKSNDLIKKYQLMDKIESFTNLPEEQFAMFYNAADLLVHPSLYEGFGLPPLQAMASGCPVIATNRTSIPEVVGDAAIMVDPTDINSLVRSMHEVLTNEVLRKDLIKRGLEQAKKFSWKKCAQETVQVYKKLWNEKE